MSYYGESSAADSFAWLITLFYKILFLPIRLLTPFVYWACCTLTPSQFVYFMEIRYYYLENRDILFLYLLFLSILIMTVDLAMTMYRNFQKYGAVVVPHAYSGYGDHVFKGSGMCFMYLNDKTWSSLGEGHVTIYYSDSAHAYRLVAMSNDSVVLLDHFITRKSNLYRDKNNNNMTRWTSVDHTSSEPKVCTFCIKWPNHASADEFEAVFHRLARLSKDGVLHRVTDANLMHMPVVSTHVDVERPSNTFHGDGRHHRCFDQLINTDAATPPTWVRNRGQEISSSGIPAEQLSSGASSREDLLFASARVPSVHLPYTAEDCRMHGHGHEKARRASRSAEHLGAGEAPSVRRWRFGEENTGKGSPALNVVPPSDDGSVATAVKGVVRKVSSMFSTALRRTDGRGSQTTIRSLVSPVATARYSSEPLQDDMSAPDDRYGWKNGNTNTAAEVLSGSGVRNNHVEDKLDELQRRVERISRDHRKLMATSNKAEAARRPLAASKERDRTPMDVNAKANEIETSEKLTEGYAAEVQRLRSDAEDLRKRLSEEQSKKHALEDERIALLTQLNLMKQDYGELLCKYNEQKLDRRRIVSEKIAELGDQGARLQSEIKRIENEMEQMKTQRVNRDLGSNNNNDGPGAKCTQCFGCHRSARVEYCESCKHCWDESHNREVRRLQQIIAELEAQHSEVMRSYANALSDNKKISISEKEKDMELSQLLQEKEAQQQQAAELLRRKHEELLAKQQVLETYRQERLNLSKAFEASSRQMLNKVDEKNTAIQKSKEV